MPSIQALVSMANSQKDLVLANKDAHDKYQDAQSDLGLRNATRVGSGRSRALQNEAEERTTDAQKIIVTAEMVVGMASAGVSLVKAATGFQSGNTGANQKAVAGIINSLTQLAGVIANAQAQQHTLTKQLEKAKALAAAGNKDASDIQGI